MFWNFHKSDLFSNFETSLNFEFATKCKRVLIKDAWFEVGNLVLAVTVKLKKKMNHANVYLSGR